jgi:hypothetical protein
MKAPSFRDREKERYGKVKKDKDLFSEEAQKEGQYSKIKREFCLADEYSHENLYRGIRDSAITYFLIRGIPWHDGLKGAHLPSNHLCCSQSCCVNFLFPLVKRPDLVKSFFGFYFPGIIEALPIDADKPLSDGTLPYIAFEWTGNPDRDYLKEGERKGRKPTRGANFTSADFIVRFREKDGHVHIVLGEWKYTEEYGRAYKGSGRDGEVRRNTYTQFFKKKDGVFSTNRDLDRLYDELFYEPFYQMMRLQLLAQEMEDSKEKEMDADIVSVLHVSPEANDGLRKNVTSAYLKDRFPGKGLLEIWEELVPPDKFKSISTEDLLNRIVNTPASDAQWVNYLKKRYGWNYPG